MVPDLSTEMMLVGTKFEVENGGQSKSASSPFWSRHRCSRRRAFCRCLNFAAALISSPPRSRCRLGLVAVSVSSPSRCRRLGLVAVSVPSPFRFRCRLHITAVSIALPPRCSRRFDIVAVVAFYFLGCAQRGRACNINLFTYVATVVQHVI